MFKAIIRRKDRSLQVFAPTRDGIREQVKSWLEAKSAREGEEIEIWVVQEVLIEKMDWKGKEIKCLNQQNV